MHVVWQSDRLALTVCWLWFEGEGTKGHNQFTSRARSKQLMSVAKQNLTIFYLAELLLRLHCAIAQAPNWTLLTVRREKQCPMNLSIELWITLPNATNCAIYRAWRLLTRKSNSKVGDHQSHLPAQKWKDETNNMKCKMLYCSGYYDNDIGPSLQPRRHASNALWRHNDGVKTRQSIERWKVWSDWD